MRSLKLGRKQGRRGFTLMEVVMALAVIGTMGAGCYVGFNSLNTYAVSSRLYSEAQTAAQNQIDLILSKEPFDPTKNPPKVPTVLGGGSCQCQTLAAGQSTTITTPNVFIYKDPVTGNTVVTGTMTTTITNPGSSMTFAGSTTELNIWRATVNVNYAYRGTCYGTATYCSTNWPNLKQTAPVSMDTMRTADQ